MTDKADLGENLRQFDALTGTTPYMPPGYEPFSPEDWAEQTRRVHAMSADAKAMLVLCVLSFIAGVIVGPFIVSLLARLWGL